MNYKDILIRALKTFIQAFVPVALGGAATIDFTDWGAAKTLLFSVLVSAGAAGLSAVWNLCIKAVEGHRGAYSPDEEDDKVEDTLADNCTEFEEIKPS